jgi:HEAT repeat protein
MRAPLLIASLALGLALALSACRGRDAQADVPGLIAELRGGDPQKSGQARLKLLQIGEPAAPALAELLRTGGPADRLAAANTLWGLGPRGSAGVTELAAALRDPDPELRNVAAMALQNMSVAAAPAVPALTAAIGDPDQRVRQAAVKALAAIGPPAQDALPALLRVLRRGSWPEAEEAVRRIRSQQPGAPVDLGTPEPGQP